MEHEIREAYWSAAMMELEQPWESTTRDEIDAVMKKTGATAFEVLTMMVCLLEELATERGIDGPFMLLAMATNRSNFRGEVRAADEMRAALKRIFKTKGEGSHG
jgi:hypothetical protein